MLRWWLGQVGCILVGPMSNFSPLPGGQRQGGGFLLGREQMPGPGWNQRSEKDLFFSDLNN